MQKRRQALFSSGKGQDQNKGPVDGHKVKWRSFLVRVAKYWHRLPRDVVKVFIIGGIKKLSVYVLGQKVVGVPA